MTSKQTKQNSVKKWWTRQLAQLKKVPKQPRNILSDSFACFGIALSLLFFYFLPSFTGFPVYWITFSLSLFFASFLIGVACVDKRYPKFYLISSWFDDMLFVPWILILTPMISYVRLVVMYGSARESGHGGYVLFLLALLAAYFIAYIFIFYFKSMKLVVRRPKPIATDTLRMVTMIGLVFLLIIIPIDHKTWLSTGNSVIWSYVAALVAVVIPLAKVTKMISNEPIKAPSILSFIGLGAIVGAVLVIVLIGASLIKNVHLMWLSFALIFVALGVLGASISLGSSNIARLRAYIAAKSEGLKSRGGTILAVCSRLLNKR